MPTIDPVTGLIVNESCDACPPPAPACVAGDGQSVVLQPYPVPGPPGIPGPSGSGSYARTAQQALSGHRVVRSVSNSHVDYADAADEDHADDVLGITLGAAASGASVNVLRLGEITEPSWAWTPLQPIFAGLNGQLTQSVPTYPAYEFSLIVGHATSATTAFIDIGQPILLR